MGNFERGRSRCLTSGSLPLRFDLSDDCVRAVGETGGKGETRDGKEKEEDDEKTKKKQKVATHQILSRLRLGFFTSLIPIFPPIRSPKNQEKIGERQQWRWREENKLFCFPVLHL